jgi:large subunit ribosomal protein L30
MADTIRVQLVRSGIGRPKSHKDTLQGLGLTKLNKTVTLKDSPSVRGMINKVIHLVKVVED